MEQFKSGRWAEIALPALILTLGMQIIRTLPPYLQYLLGDRLRWGSVQLGLAGLLIFSTAFLTAWLNRRLGLGRLLTLTAVGVGLARLGMQLWTGDPLVDMVLMMGGTVLFLLFLPAFMVLTQRQDHTGKASVGFGQAILVGLLLDTALHGLFLTYDFIWQTGLIPLALTLGLVLLQWFALSRVVARLPSRLLSIQRNFLGTWPWLAVGPFFFLQLLIFQNQARLVALTNWPLLVVFGGFLLAHLLGLLAVTRWQLHRTGTAILGVTLVLTLWPFEFSSPSMVTLALLVGHLATVMLLVTTLRSLGESRTRVYSPAQTQPLSEIDLNSITVWHGIGMLLMVGLIFGYYVTFSLAVPYQNGWLPGLAGLLLGLCGVGAAAPKGIIRPINNRSALLLALPWLLMLLPLFLPRSSPASAPTESRSIRVMTYNVHNGFNAAGRLDLETLAQVIEAQQPDIIAWQELSRGWVVNGSVDMLTWLSRRLEMPYSHFTPSSDALWGQALFSRYPILLAEDHPLPPRDLPMPRSFTYFRIDVGRPQPLQLINTHLHHVQEDSDIRLVQIETILTFLANQESSRSMIMTGDLNARPNSMEIQPLYEWGLRDAVIESNLVFPYTYDSIRPYKRLDYLLFSSDLTMAEVVIPLSTASDHLPIASTIAEK